MKRSELIKEALKLLDAGTLPTTLPNRLMEKFDLTASQAQAISQVALNKRQKRNRQKEGIS